jgi:hypothetical protein
MTTSIEYIQELIIHIHMDSILIILIPEGCSSLTFFLLGIEREKLG